MLNNSKTVLNIKKIIMYQVFMLNMLSFEVKLILCVSSPLKIMNSIYNEIIKHFKQLQEMTAKNILNCILR